MGAIKFQINPFQTQIVYNKSKQEQQTYQIGLWFVALICLFTSFKFYPEYIKGLTKYGFSKCANVSDILHTYR